MVRPVQELAGFARVTLQPGEEANVTFKVEPSVIAFLDAHMKWKIEKGLVDLEIGSSSSDIRLQSTIIITENAWINGPDRMFSAIGKTE